MGSECTTEELRDRLPRVQPVEALGPSYFGTGHIPGAVSIPPHRVAELAAALPPDTSTPIVVYDAHRGSCAADVVVRQLRPLGYGDVSRYPDGKEGWVQAGLPLVGEPAGDDARTARSRADVGAASRGQDQTGSEDARRE